MKEVKRGTAQAAGGIQRLDVLKRKLAL